VQVGDLVRYYDRYSAVVLYINEDGGTVKALLPSGETGWLVKSGCEVIGETGWLVKSGCEVIGANR